VKSVPNSSSVSDALSTIGSSAQQLASAAKSTMAQLSGCTSSSSTTTTTG
jgi:hypothetical protein